MKLPKGIANKLNHGEAVILGIISSAKFSFVNKILSQNIYENNSSYKRFEFII